MARNQVVPVRHTRCQKPGGVKMAPAIMTLTSMTGVPSWHIYMKFTQMDAHNFCELHITNLSSELCVKCGVLHNFLFEF